MTQLALALDTCELTACRTCTGCVHGQHATCRATVTCPTDGVTRDCECCRTTVNPPAQSAEGATP